MKNPDPLEKDIEKRVCKYAASLGILHYKFTSPARRSVPDQIFVLPDGEVFMIEFKRRGEKPTPSQTVEIEKLRKQGVNVYMVDNVTDGEATVQREMMF